MRHTYRVTYKVTNGDITEKHGGYDPRFPLGERIILHGYVHAHDIHDAWEKARKKFGDVRNVE